MPGLVYTFKRNGSEPTPPGYSRTPATDAVIAVAFAATGERGIFFEELTSADAPQPIYSVVFQTGDLMKTFERRIETAASLQLLTIANVQPIGQSATADDVGETQLA